MTHSRSKRRRLAKIFKGPKLRKTHRPVANAAREGRLRRFNKRKESQVGHKETGLPTLNGQREAVKDPFTGGSAKDFREVDLQPPA